VSRFEGRLRDIWYGGREPGWILRGLSALYGLVVRLRRAAYRRGLLRTHRVDVPVIVVGNLTVGGSGKTPLVIALVEYLRSQGWSPGVVSRGYGRKSRGQRIVDAQTIADEGGDEPVLIARRCNVPVVVDADRVAAARRAVELGARIVIADDGLQHYRLHRDMEIEVIDGTRRHGNARLLPAGPLREPEQRATECDLCVVNGDASLSGEWSMKLIGNTLTAQGGRRQPLDGWHGKRVHAVAGIGNPERFFRSLREYGLEVVEHAFGDHHAFVPGDLQFDEDLPVVMTEKDWVKCAAFAPADAWMLPVRAECPDRFFEDFRSRLHSNIGKPHGKAP
jgi:tetraacyldisaccharide 4'-kinase